MDNVVLYRKGNLSRRFGMNFEPDHALSSWSVSDVTVAIREFTWKAVGNDINVNFLVFQVGLTVRFYDMSVVPLSNGLKAFTLDMATHLAPNQILTQAALCELQFSSGKGYLFVSGEKFEPLIITYDAPTDTITGRQVHILMRDFVGLNDSLANDAEPPTLSLEHHYNLLNQGWVTPSNSGGGASQLIFDSFGQPGNQNSAGETPITDFYSYASRYPGNNKQWWVARDSTTNAFKPSLLDTFFYGAGRSPRGHFVLDAFTKDRGAISGLIGIPIEAVNDRPTANTFFSGRAWWVSASNVYVSQVLDDKNKAGLCFQEGDPTAEAISDLIATDGLVIPIPEMGKALRSFPASSGVLIFASNGIWFVSGGAGGFTALDFEVVKVSSVGVNAPNSIVDTKNGIFWFDSVGVRNLVVHSTNAGPQFELQTISQDTIQTYIQDNIPTVNYAYIKGAYDTQTNTVQWLWNSLAGTNPYFYDTVLTLDMSLGSFAPASLPQDGPMVVGIFTTQDPNKIDAPFKTSVRDQTFKYTTLVPTNLGFQFSFSYFRDYTFVDWGSVDYLSFIESGYELLDDAMRKKEQNYVFVYFRRTEENYVEDLPDYPSSCFFQTKWDWASSEISGKWTNKVQSYRHQRLPLYSGPDAPFDTGFPIVISKNKVRGDGRAIQFRFESGGPGKDFDLLGWAVAYSGNTSP